MEDIKEFYRFNEICNGYSNWRLNKETFYLLRETPKGYWIARKGYTLGKCSFKPTWESAIWVSKTASKRYAYPTEEEALSGFFYRKNRQVKILKSQLSKAEAGLKLAKDEMRKRSQLLPIENQKGEKPKIHIDKP